MELTREQESTIIRVVNVYETGSGDGDYACISIHNDGPHDISQISYGKNQATEYRRLRTLVQRYVDAEGSYSDQAEPVCRSCGLRTPVRKQEIKKALAR